MAPRRPASECASHGRRTWLAGRLEVRHGPLDFEKVLRYQLRGGREPVDRAAGGACRRVMHLPGGAPALIEVWPDHPSRTRALEVRSLSRPLAAADRRAALEKAKRMYSLDFDLTAFYRHALRTPPLDRLVRGLRGLRVSCFPEPFEALAWAVMGQQISLGAAIQIKRRLVEACGEWVERDGERHAAFPAPARVAAMGEAGLRAVGLTASKARYVGNLARAIVTRELDPEGLREVSPEARREALLSLPGIGPWTASYVELRGYGGPDAFPLADVGLEVAATQLYGSPRRLSGPSLARVSEAWRPYRGWVTFYLWYGRLREQQRI